MIKILDKEHKYHKRVISDKYIKQNGINLQTDFESLDEEYIAILLEFANLY